MGRLKRNTAYLKRFDDILEEIEKEHCLYPEEVDKVIDEFFYTFNGFITDSRMPTVKISNLGTFKPNPVKINRHIWKAVQVIRNGTDNEDYYRAKIAHLWQIKQRLIKESNGELTWKCWRNKELKHAQEQIKKKKD